MVSAMADFQKVLHGKRATTRVPELPRKIKIYFLPSDHATTKSRSCVAETLDKLVHVCKTGCQWAAIEGHDGVSYKTVYHWFRLWSKARVFENAFYNLATLYRQASQRPLVADSHTERLKSPKTPRDALSTTPGYKPRS
jgi:transposase